METSVRMKTRKWRLRWEERTCGLSVFICWRKWEIRKTGRKCIYEDQHE